jgi:hypothetical protein
MPRIIQTLQPIDKNSPDKRPLVLFSMDYHEAVIEASKHLQLDIKINDETEETYLQSISLIEEALIKNGWRIEASRDYPYEDLHMMSLFSQRNQDVSL